MLLLSFIHTLQESTPKRPRPIQFALCVSVLDDENCQYLNAIVMEHFHFGAPETHFPMDQREENQAQPYGMFILSC